VAIMNGLLVQGIAPTRIPNPDLKWETTEQLNLGFDIGLFDSRLSLTMDYFEKTTEDMLLNLPIPGTSGFNSILTNIGSIQNKGFEFLLESWNITGKDFSWNTKLNFSTIKNEVLGLGTVDEIIVGNLPFTQGVSIIRPGEELNSYYGMFVDGILHSLEQLPDNLNLEI
jgi:outer membrane receptor protein involved in Fe transport